jgi:aryl-alcohol dehydrogenase-like predicted oxidoreductase
MHNFRLALGTVQFGMPYGIANQAGQVHLDEVRAILDVASANAIDTIDTAIAYGNSEACLGACCISGFNVVTKLPLIPENATDIEGWITEQVEASLKRLRISSLYGLLLHRSWQFQKASVRVALERLKESGTVQKIGVSIYSPDELYNIFSSGSIDIIQAPLNVVDRRLVESGWLQRMHYHGIEIHTRSAFLQGLLLMPRKSIPERFSVWNHIWDTWQDWRISMNMTAVEACLGYALSLPEVNKVVVGVETAAQIGELIEASRKTMKVEFPDIASTDEQLINPSFWTSL